jgi:hypothetical protein
MATIAASEERSVSIGRIFSRAFGTIASNPLVTLGIAFAFGALPTLLLFYLGTSLGTQIVTTLGGAAAIAMALFSAVIAIVLSMITQGALVRATVAFSEGRKASFGESAMAGLVVAVPLFLLSLLSALGIGLGFLLLVVPGIMLYVRWAVSAPALVEERLGPIEALGRSGDLTDGVRWKVFGLLLVLMVLNWLFSALVTLIAALPSGGPLEIANSGSPLTVTYMAVTVISGTITSAVWGVVQSSLYIELRDWKDGPRTEQLADIFA